MSTTFLDLRTLTLSWLDDPQGAYFTAAQVNVWLNNAQRELQKKLIAKGENYYVQRLQGTMIANTDSYTLPTDFKKNHKLEIVLSGTAPTEVKQTLLPVTYMQLDQVAMDVGAPRAVCFKRNAMIVRPVPDQAYTMYLHQSYQVVDMVNDADIPDVPHDYAEYIAVLATLDGFMKDQRQASEFVMLKQKAYEDTLTKDAQQRDVSAPRSIISLEDNSYGILT